jgi:hypothetical protein
MEVKGKFSLDGYRLFTLPEDSEFDWSLQYNDAVGISIQLFFDSMASLSSRSSKRYFFFLRHKNSHMRTYYFYTESKDDWQRWIVALAKICSSRDSLVDGNGARLSTEPLPIKK